MTRLSLFDSIFKSKLPQSRGYKTESVPIQTLNLEFPYCLIFAMLTSNISDKIYTVYSGINC